MPTICMFRGIKIYINWREHQPPHFHATYGEQEVIVSINELEVIDGEKRLYNVAPFLKPGTVFEPFTNIENFRRVYIDDEHCVAWDIDPSVDSNVVWSNKVDLCPDGCYVDSVPLTEVV